MARRKGLFCTEDNFEISPGLSTHQYTVAEIKANPDYGCCQARPHTTPYGASRRHYRRACACAGPKMPGKCCARSPTYPPSAAFRPQKFVCGLACPQEFDNAGVAVNFGVPVMVMAAFFIVFGLIAGLLTVKKNDAKASGAGLRGAAGAAAAARAP
jgi:hypothetical protein